MRKFNTIRPLIFRTYHRRGRKENNQVVDGAKSVREVGGPVGSAAERFMWGLGKQLRYGFGEKLTVLGEGGALESTLIILDFSFVVFFLLVLVVFWMYC